MNSTNWQIMKMKRIRDMWLYLDKLPMENYAVIVRDENDYIIESYFYFDYVDALHCFTKLKQELLIEYKDN